MAQLPQVPSYFLKPTTSLSAHLAPVVRPAGCRFLNYEGEVAVVIGRRCRGVDIGEALDYVRGYTVANDWGVHDFRHADRGSMLRVKGQDGFCPLGPALVDASDVDPEDLTLRTFVDGAEVQRGHTGSDLMFSFAYQIADIARLITLEPGDVLLTGTPANSRPVEPGAVVAVEVEGIGRFGEHGRRVGTRSRRGRSAARGDRADLARRAGDPRGGGRAEGRSGPVSVERSPGTRLEIASVVDQVYTAIRQRIADGSLPRGARVHQEGLAEELGVSRTPVREALRRLAAEGLVEMRTNRGAKVLDIDRVGMRAAYEARVVIEPGAARLAAKLGDRRALARMASAVAQQRRSLRSVAAQLRRQPRLPSGPRRRERQRVSGPLLRATMGGADRRGDLRAPA